jgi:hypothetical protein
LAAINQLLPFVLDGTYLIIYLEFLLCFIELLCYILDVTWLLKFLFASFSDYWKSISQILSLDGNNACE